jgi:hypothetical protein
MIVFYKYLLDSVSVTVASIYRVERKRSCESLTLQEVMGVHKLQSSLPHVKREANSCLQARPDKGIGCGIPNADLFAS